MSLSSISADRLGLLRACLEVAPDALLAIDRQGQVVLANARAEVMFGAAPASLHGLPLDALLAEPTQRMRVLVDSLFATTPGVHAGGKAVELTGRTRDGHPFPLELVGAVSDLGLAVASLRDVAGTLRVRQVQRRTRLDSFTARISQVALESPDYEEAISRIPGLVIEALDVPAAAILSSDWHRNAFRIRAATGLTTTTAECLVAIFGDGELTHRAFADEERVPITSAEPVGAAAATIRAGLLRTRYQHFAMVPLFGRYEPLGILIALAMSEDAFEADKVAFLQGVAHVLTATVQRSHAEEQLAHAQRLDTVGQLTGGIAHDFNNLLTVVSGNLQLLETELHDQPQAREIIDGALRAVDRGADLTRKLLTFARRQSLKPHAIQPGPLLAELGQMLRRTLGETIAIQVECAPDTPAVFADPNELDTALVNLALNARDAMPRGGRLNIAAREFSAARDEVGLAPGRYVVFQVGDTGTGMARDVQMRACEPFFTTKGGGKGSGLGLSMVYGFVTQSGGRLRIDSRLGYGTRVEIILPVAAEQPRAEAGEAVAGQPGQRGTILVVEDEAEVRNVSAAFLRAMDFEVLATGSAGEALQWLTARPRIDVLFSDVVLGGSMDGVELANAARRLRPHLPVLLTSGYSGAVPALAGATASYPLLHKPYRREQLEAALQAVLAAGSSVQRAGQPGVHLQAGGIE